MSDFSAEIIAHWCEETEVMLCGHKSVTRWLVGHEPIGPSELPFCGVCHDFMPLVEYTLRWMG